VLITAPAVARKSLEACRPKDRSDIAFEVVEAEGDRLALRIAGEATVRFPPEVDVIKGVTDASKIAIVKTYGNNQSVDLTRIMKIAPTADGFAVTLDEAAKDQTVEVDGEQIPVTPVLSDADEAESPLEMTDETVTLGVKTIPGLKYQLKKCAVLGGVWTSVGNPQTATGARLRLTAERGSDPAAFYTITVTK